MSIGANDIVTHLCEAIQETVHFIYPKAPTRTLALLPLGGKIVDNLLKLTASPDTVSLAKASPPQCNQWWQLLVTEGQQTLDEIANFAMQLALVLTVDGKSTFGEMLVRAAKLLQASVATARLVVYVFMSTGKTISAGNEFEYQACA